LPYPTPLPSDRFAAVERELEAIRTRKIPPELSVDTIIRHGVVFDGILEVAREIGADLIITTTHGHTGLKHLLMGSTAENVVQKAPCPVLVVRECEHDFV
jgi:nucleotide-binding universal stress UspA family protein